MNTSYKVVRPTELARKLSVSTVTLWRMEKRGELPPRRQISKRVVGWFESDLVEWAEKRPFVNKTVDLEEGEK